MVNKWVKLESTPLIQVFLHRHRCILEKPVSMMGTKDCKSGCTWGSMGCRLVRRVNTTVTWDCSWVTLDCNLDSSVNKTDLSASTTVMSVSSLETLGCSSDSWESNSVT